MRTSFPHCGQAKNFSASSKLIFPNPLWQRGHFILFASLASSSASCCLNSALAFSKLSLRIDSSAKFILYFVSHLSHIKQLNLGPFFAIGIKKIKKYRCPCHSKNLVTVLHFGQYKNLSTPPITGPP